MTHSTDSLFEQALERYQAGNSAQELIPLFKQICDRAPKNGAAFTCLAWLYLLDDKPNAAYKAAQKAVKLTPQDPQSRVNLALAMLETGKKGVRDHIDAAIQGLSVSSELREEVQRNLEEGLNRKPAWQALQRVRKWLFES